MTLEALRDGDPRHVGPYALLGRLGEGGMGVVYLGQGPDGTRVAVKLIHARMDADAGFRRRFAREVAAAKRVARFCTAPVLDADVEGDVAYLVTEFVEGPSLDDVVRASGPLTGSALDGLAAAMAMALRAIHGAGVVHRDLKPSNVLLSQVGPKVIDFGIAQLADAEMSSAVVGTPAYMSPEQVSGSPIGPASDIFSWGCTVAYAAGGIPPFGSGSVPTVLMRIINEAPDLRGLSGTLRDLVVAALAKNPAERPTAQDLMDGLSASVPSPPSAAPPPATPHNAGMAGGISPDAAGQGATAPSAAHHSTTTPGAGAADASGQGAVGPGAAGSSAAAPGPVGPERPVPGAAGSSAAAPGPVGLDGAGSDEGAFGRRRKLLAAAAAVVVAVAGTAAALVWKGPGGSAEGRSPAAADATAGDGGTNPAGTGNPGRTATTATPAPRNAQNPLRAQDDVRFYAPAELGASRQATIWEAGNRRVDAELMRKLAAVPHAVRLNEPEVRAKVEETITGAEQSGGGVPVFLINYMPGSECRPIGASDMAAYQDWIKGIAGQINDAKAVIILEPGSLVKIAGTKDCDPQGSPGQRYKDLRQAAQTLKANPNTAVYLDGSQDLYPGTETMAERLIATGIDKADGFFVNTAGHQRTDKAVAYGKKLSACIAVRLATGRTGCPADATVDPARMPHFVVDTSRNGQGGWAPTKHYSDPQTWCNPPGRGVGPRPTTQTQEELVDAYLWIARAGTSSGRCRRGTNGDKDPERGVVAPEAGEWWGELALERAKLANPPLR
ncbi:serine/threonine protein kinase [Nonomuraea polychroma]|uniref:Serine/threonine protein kinase n=1 Tax=Nonomuraea polychroma TaxID=46176 RepID=A0A438LXP0_9ACTN|nr:glycoside hydrolase family 6 protein [Nonomuraea polychroma]RVX38221.1 serine/threonine protein kinase [Nonomuraea polychroma]